MLDMALNAVEILPQRILRQMRALPRWARRRWWISSPAGRTGKAPPPIIALIDELSEAMKLTSICGLGQFVPARRSLGAEAFSRRNRSAHHAPRMPGRRVLPRAARRQSPKSAPHEARMSDVTDRTHHRRQAVTVPAGTTVFDAARMQRHRDPHAVPSAERNARGRVPRMRGGCGRRACWRHPACGRPKTGWWSPPIPKKCRSARRTLRRNADGRSSQPVRPPAAFGRLRTRNAGATGRHQQPRFPRRTSRRAARTIPRSPSRWITKRASCATAAFAAATRSATTTCSAAAARASMRASRSTDNLPMGNSSCVSCGECMVSCPTGALTNKGVTQTVLARPSANRWTRRTAAACLFPKGLGNISRAEPERRGAAAFQGGRDRFAAKASTARPRFTLLEGKAQVSLSTPMAHVKTARRQHGILQQADQPLARRSQRSPRRRGRQRYDSDRRARGFALRQSRGRAGPGRSVRRNDLHEPVSALGHGARRDRLHDVRDAAQRARHHAAQQEPQGAAGRKLSPARAGQIICAACRCSRR